MPDPDIKPVAEAVKALEDMGISVSPAWIYSLLNEGKVTRYSRPLDDKRYVSVKELAHLLTPRAEGDA